MKQCKALLQKEWDTHKFLWMIPFWATVGVYLMALAGYLIALAKGNSLSAAVSVQGMPAGFDAYWTYAMTTTTTVLLGLVSVITAASLADSMINGGFKRHCEILHFSQPVSFLKIVGVKYFSVTLASILLFGLLSLLNAVVVILLGKYFLAGDFQFGLMGWLQSFIHIALAILFVGSLAWFFAGLFKHKSFLLGLLMLLGFEVLIGVLNYTVGWNIPSLFEFFGGLVSINFGSVEETAQAYQHPMQDVIAQGWNAILSLKSLLKLILSAVFTVVGAWLYKYRELS